MAPPFFFRTIEIQPHSASQPQLGRNCLWLPPKIRGASVVAPGSRVQDFFFDGQRAQPVPDFPVGVQHYKTASVYYHESNFWVVPYDVLNTQVADGREGASSDSEQEDYDDDEDENDDDDPFHWDWGPLFFNAGHSQASYVTYFGSYQRLIMQREDQHWVQHLFPDMFHSEHTLPTGGGLIGDLPLIIALIAFTVRPSEIQAALAQCMKGDSWKCTSLPRGRGCT